MKRSTTRNNGNTDIKIAVIFVGMQGAGKTEFYERYFSDAYTRVCLSELVTRQNEKALICDCINHGISYVIDSQNLTREDRRRYFKKAKDAGYRMIGYYFPSTVKESLERAGLTHDKNALRRQKKAIEKIEIPDYSEGYDELYTVTVTHGGDFFAQRMKTEEAEKTQIPTEDNTPNGAE